MTARNVRSATLPGFNFTDHIRLLCDDIVSRVPELLYIDLARVAISFSQARSSNGHGLQATLTPMRFEGGALTTRRRGRQYAVQRIFDPSGQEFLYLLSFYLPRFLNQPLEEKIGTVVHELFHIGPKFDGDLRRFEGRCFAHGPSQQSYDRQVDRIAENWWSLAPPEHVYSFLKGSFLELQRRHGRVIGTKIPNPKLIPIGIDTR